MSNRTRAKMAVNALRVVRSESVRPIALRVSLKTALRMVREDRAAGLRGVLVGESCTHGSNVVEVR